MTAPAKKNDYVPGTEIDLRLKLSKGETMTLNCNVKWAYENSPEDMTKSVGLEIIDPPREYITFIKTLP